MKKLILFTLTTILLLNCSNGANEPCKDENCITDEQLNFFKMHLDDTLTKKVLFEMSSMDLSSKSITSLDTGIFNNLINLTSVDLTDNPICIVDKADVGLADGVNLNFEIGQCLTDAQLAFFMGHITDLDTKQKLYEATELDLSSNSISSLDTGIFTNLTNLTDLNLSFNGLTSIPAEIGNLNSLTILSLFHNNLTSIPAEIGNLNSLTQLYLYNNKLTSIPAEIGNLNSLTQLYLYSNDLTSIPASIPAEIGNLTNLTTLWLYDNDLTSIPAEIGNLNSLTQLYLYSNDLISIPAEIGNLTNLTTLWLYDNKLTSIPTEIGNLTSLTELWLSRNDLANIPDGIFTNLTSLTTLQLKNSGPGEMNSFDCNDTKYSTWGLTDPTTTITNFRCS